MAHIICVSGYIILILSALLLMSPPPIPLMEVGITAGVGAILTLLGYIGRIAVAYEERVRKL